MNAGEIIAAAAGVAAMLGGLRVIVRNRAVADALADWENDVTRRSSLLNAERLDRIQASVENPDTRILDRGKAVFLGVWLILAGAALLGVAF